MPRRDVGTSPVPGKAAKGRIRRVRQAVRESPLLAQNCRSRKAVIEDRTPLITERSPDITMPV
jgi:hypothetical protein